MPSVKIFYSGHNISHNPTSESARQLIFFCSLLIMISFQIEIYVLYLSPAQGSQKALYDIETRGNIYIRRSLCCIHGNTYRSRNFQGPYGWKATNRGSIQEPRRENSKYYILLRWRKRHTLCMHSENIWHSFQTPRDFLFWLLRRNFEFLSTCTDIWPLFMTSLSQSKSIILK